MRNKTQVIILSFLSFVTLLIILSSVIFSVQHIDGYCYNEYSPQENESIIDININGLKKGKSIFLLDEEAVISSIESNLTNVKVINVERKFPNRLCINYVKLYDYLSYTEGGFTYYIANNGRIISKVENANVDASKNIIKLKFSGNLVSKNPGEYFTTDNEIDFAVLTGLLDALGRFKFSYALETFDFVDISHYLSKGLIFLQTKTGAMIELQGSISNVLDKLQGAISVYESKENQYKMSGTIIANSSASKFFYSEKNRYDQIN